MFLQNKHTAIGTKMAPSYAILFMSKLEEKLLETFSLKPTVWWRYIDDIFFLWDHGEESLKDFIQHLNSAHPTIKFTAEYSKDTINFLDFKVSKQGTRLVSDLYIKPSIFRPYFVSPNPLH